MRARWARVSILTFSGMAVLLVAVVNLGRTSPGPLARVHSEQSDLQGRWSCSQCHGGIGESMAHACLECHEEIEAHLAQGRGLHGALGRERTRLCASCHSDHHGEGFALVNVQSFAQAGVEDPQDFDHGSVGFAMEGRHLELECGECHAHAQTRFLSRGERRFIGLESSCVSCHEDPHAGRLGPSCTSCHGQEAFDRLESVGHERFLALAGGHAELDCRTCHAADGEHSLERLAGEGDRPAARDCESCHASPHAASFAAAVAASVEMTSGAACVTCHLAAHNDFALAEERVDAALHALADFPLSAPHDALACSDCHGAGADFAQRYPGRGRDRCEACHDDPHGGQFEQGAFAGQGCIVCHDRERFEPHAFGPAEHERTALALSGSHLDAACNACHELPAQGGPRAFHGTSDACESCHADAHRGAFDRLPGELAAELAALEHGRCARCHLPSAFSEVAREDFDHGQWTGFVVDGAHAQERCEQCHPRAQEPDERGRRFGFVSEHFGAFAGCVTCHDDPHRGAFDAQGMPAAVDGRGDCARCHDTTSFRLLAPSFDHGLWTGWELRGAHRAAACAACHEPLRRPDSYGRTWERAQGTDCADCHADPHAGQFERDGRSDCARCHEDEARWADLVFDHDRDSRFPLEDAHAGLDCAACHRPEAHAAPGEAAQAAPVTRYRPLRTDCVGCHGSQRAPLLRKRRSAGEDR